MDIKPIETRYSGYKFRSRLEARWAFYWDTVGMKYEYEKEGFDLGPEGYYLPDFWIPSLKSWVEIKGEHPTPEEMRKCERLAERGDMVFLVYGPLLEHKTYGWAKGWDSVVMIPLNKFIGGPEVVAAFVGAREERFERGRRG